MKNRFGVGRFGNPQLWKILGLFSIITIGLLIVLSQNAIASIVYMDDFEDGDYLGWQETIVSGRGGGSFGVDIHNTSEMAYSYHWGEGVHSLSYDFDYLSNSTLSFDMHAVAVLGYNLYGNALHSNTGVVISFLNFLNSSIEELTILNATNSGTSGVGIQYVDSTQHNYSATMLDFAKAAGLDESDPITKISLEFYATGDFYSGGNIYPDGASNATVWFDNVTVEAVPVPAAAWLLGSGLLGLVGLRKRMKK